MDGQDGNSRVPWHAGSSADALGKLNATEDGLSDAEAAKRLSEHGRNVIKEKKQKSIWKMLWEQISDVMVLVLIAAAIVSMIFSEWAEAVVILVIVVLNAVIGIVQEKKAANALRSLMELSAPTARVLREGEESVIPAEELVPGDIVYLEDGCIVPADMRLIHESNLKIQEASLTGESVPVEKDAGAILGEDAPLGDRINMAYSSSVVMYGTGVGVVVETGMHTQVGSIAGMLENQNELDTPLKKKLNSVGKILSVVGLIVSVLIFGIGLAYGRNWLPILMTAVSLAISIIPEGLPATATVVMALSVQRMAKQQALVRSLPAVETLGSATVICCDKTGTLTQNRMTVTHFAVDGDFERGELTQVSASAQGKAERYRELLYASVLCNNAAKDPDQPGETLGDPTEGALLYFAEKFGIDNEAAEDACPRVFEQPFDSDRKRMSTVNRVDGAYHVYTKGAVDELLPLCTRFLDDDGVRPMTEKDRAEILALSTKMSEQALRVLGYATKILPDMPEEDADVENDLTFVGLTGMIDPPRTEVIQAVETCHTAGIRVIMITGDHKTTAVAIARQLKIYRKGNTVISGPELDEMTDEQLDAAVRTATVFARVSPSDKLRIVQSLQRTGEVVSMTGDGVNDSPALKAADIGVAMGAGTDVAKGAADMILMDNNFTTIEYAVREGRRVYRNIQKVIQFLLAGNIAEILVLFLATLFNWEAPILAVHVLLINLATDTLPALALGVDPASKNIMKHPPVKSGTLFERGLVMRVCTHGLIIGAATLAAYFIGLLDNHGVGMTMAFTVLALSQLIHALNQRSNTESVFSRGNGHNLYLFGAMMASAVVLVLVLFVPPIQAFFSLSFLTWREYLITIALSVTPLLIVEAIKLVKRYIRKKKHIAIDEE